MTTIGENFRDKVDTLVAEYIKELEEKNQTLKDKIEFLTNCLDDRDKSIAIMQEENKTLKSEIRRITNQRDNLKGISDNLVDENRYLEEQLDNKEKLNKSYREEIDKLKIDLKLYENAYGHMFE